MRRSYNLILSTIVFFSAVLIIGCESGSSGGGGDNNGIPIAPTGVVAAPGVRQTSIKWNGVAGATGYNLYWSTSPGITANSTKITSMSSPYVHAGLTAGIKYYYRLTSSNSAGESGLSIEVSAIPHITVGEAVADHIINIPYELPTIQSGLNAAGSGDEVRVHNGTYYENLTWPGVDGIKLKSVNGPATTIIDGGYLKGVIAIIDESSSFNITSATRIEGFTITNGNFAEIINQSYGNDYDGGGGIYLWNTSPTILNNIITENNSEYHGGGISASWTACPVITNNHITNNTASKNGGGIYCRNVSNATITNNTIRNNSAFWCGGGLYSSPATTIVNTGNTITNNYDYDCYSTPDCANNCDITGQGITFDTGGNTGGGTGSSGNSACDSCLAGCSGLTSCCTGYGCICYDECIAPCPAGTHMYCTMWGDCFCVPD